MGLKEKIEAKQKEIAGIKELQKRFSRFVPKVGETVITINLDDRGIRELIWFDTDAQRRLKDMGLIFKNKKNIRDALLVASMRSKYHAIMLSNGDIKLTYTIRRELMP